MIIDNPPPIFNCIADDCYLRRRSRETLYQCPNASHSRSELLFFVQESATLLDVMANVASYAKLKDGRVAKLAPGGVWAVGPKVPGALRPLASPLAMSWKATLFSCQVWNTNPLFSPSYRLPVATHEYNTHQSLAK